MIQPHRLLALLAWLAIGAGCASAGRPPAALPLPAPTAAIERALPYPVTVDPGFLRAIERGTRTTSGAPGPRHWRQWVEYTLTARVDPATHRLTGTAHIVYHNNSPDSLPTLNLQLLQNHHAPGAPRGDEAEVTGGFELARVTVDGRELAPSSPDAQPTTPRYDVYGTRLRIVPPAPVRAGGTTELAIAYGFTIPENGIGGRMGRSRDDLIYLAYFYPQMAVYDDVIGWHTDQFLGNAEFYADYGTYDVTLEAPSDWLVLGTGALQNAAETLAEPVRARLAQADASDAIVHVVTPAEFGRGATGGAPGAQLRWHFQADSVNDVAYSLTRAAHWDATRTPVGDRDGDGATDYVRINAIYRPAAPRWREAARYAQHAIRFLSDFTATPYPWPHMTAVEGAGIIGGGMEYPMMTLIGDYTARGDSALYAVVVHELAHMWVPMQLNNNERRYAWMDEGTTTFNENQGKKDFFPGPNWDLPEQQSYLEVARAGLEGELMRWSDYHYPGPAYGVASYDKPGTILAALRGLLGEETFLRAYHAFFDRWQFRHPYPWDLWNTFEDVSGRDLDWFWRSWYFETWLLDQAVADVTPAAGGTRITIADEGDVPMPVRLTITHAGGATEEREIPVDVWLTGTRRTAITVPGDARVVRVEIDAAQVFPDADRGDNVWPR